MQMGNLVILSFTSFYTNRKKVSELGRSPSLFRLYNLSPSLFRQQQVYLSLSVGRVFSQSSAVQAILRSTLIRLAQKNFAKYEAWRHENYGAIKHLLKEAAL